MPSKKVAIKLKKLGLIDYDLRKRLHWKQKEKIDRLSREYSEPLARPQQFIMRTIGKETAANLKRAGYETFKNVRTGKITSLIKIQDDAIKVKITKKNVFVKYDGFTEKWLTGVAPSDLEKELRRLKKQQEKSPHNFQITGKIGDNAPFKHSRFASVEQLERYLKSWEINYPSNIKGQRARDSYRQDLIQHLSVVQIDMDFRQGKPSGQKTKKNRRH